MARDTKQRRAIRGVFQHSGRPLSPEEVLVHGKHHVPGLGMATVYRNIRDLMDTGWLREVELPGESSRYELSGKHHHHHFVCRVCQQAFDIEGCALEVHAGVPEGFRVESHEVVLYGVCSRCGP